jgi:hypothetical protein
MSYLHLYNEIKHQTIAELAERLDNGSKAAIINMKLVDLIHEDEPSCGVYIFYNQEGKPCYVGKSSSRTFIERISSHLDSRKGAFFSSFLWAIAKSTRNNVTEKQLRDAYIEAIKCQIAFIHLKDKEKCIKLEKYLIYYFKNRKIPILNKLKEKQFDETKTIEKLLA